MAAKVQRVKVARAFRHRGEDVGEDSVLDLDMPTAKELRNARKVEFVASDVKVVQMPLRQKARPKATESAQVAALAAEVARLTALVEKGAKQAAPKEKANA